MYTVVVHLTGGVADCKSRTLRTIGNAELSFASDPARILRAIRLAARAGSRCCACICDTWCRSDWHCAMPVALACLNFVHHC